MKDYKFFIPIIIIGMFFLTGAISAQVEAGVVISPHIIDEKAKARDVLEFTITLVNNTDKKVSIYPVVNDISETDGQQAFIDPHLLDKTESLARWIEFQRSLIELMPSEEKQVPLKINIDLNAKPGKRYAVITLPQGNNRPLAEASMEMVNYPQIMINIAVEEEIIEKAQIIYFRTDKNIYFYLPVSFSFTVANSGNRGIIPAGGIYVYNRRGQEVDRLDINATRETVAAGAEKNFSVVWADGSGFGKFKARLEAEYGDKSRRDLIDTIYFWILPVKLLIVYGGGLMLALIIITAVVFRRTYYGQHPRSNSVRPEGNVVVDLRSKKN